MVPYLLSDLSDNLALRGPHYARVARADSARHRDPLLLGQPSMFRIRHNSAARVGEVHLLQFDVFVVGNELFNHHRTTANLDNQVHPHVLNVDLLGTVRVVALTDALPRYWAALLVDVVSQSFINQVTLHRDVELKLWLDWLHLFVHETSQLTFKVFNDLVLHLDVFFEGFHLVKFLINQRLQVRNLIILLVQNLLLGI